VGDLPEARSHYAARAQVQHRLADDRLMTSIMRSRKPKKSAKKRMLIIVPTRRRRAVFALQSGAAAD
jgi:hypothetical protein